MELQPKPLFQERSHHGPFIISLLAASPAFAPIW
jgi:hypothetical protein